MILALSTLSAGLPCQAGKKAAGWEPALAARHHPIISISKRDVMPIPRTIGADPGLREHIERSLDALISAREARLGYAARRAVIVGFKRDFAMMAGAPWASVWDWPEHRAAEVLNYLEGRYAETVGKTTAD